MWWGYHGFHPFGLVFFVLLVGLLFFRHFAFRRWGRGCPRWQDGHSEAEAILKRRLASGEISEDDYSRLKEILTK